jgi:hypothetical protein
LASLAANLPALSGLSLPHLPRGTNFASLLASGKNIIFLLLISSSALFFNFLIILQQPKMLGKFFFGQTGGVAYDSLDGPFLFHL